MKNHLAVLPCDDFLDIELKASYQAVLRVALDEQEALRINGEPHASKVTSFNDKEVSASQL